MVFRRIDAILAGLLSDPAKLVAAANSAPRERKTVEPEGPTGVTGEGGIAPGKGTAGSGREARAQPADARTQGDAARMEMEKAPPEGVAVSGAVKHRGTIAPTLHSTIEHKCGSTHIRPESRSPTARVLPHLCLCAHHQPPSS